MPIQKFRSRLAAALTGLLLIAPSAPVSATEPGWYGGFSAGESEITDTDVVSDLCSIGFVTCNDANNDTAWQAIVGYQINNYIGIEGAYFDLGSPSLGVSAPVAANATVEVSGVSISALPQIPIGSIGGIFGRLGIAAGDVEGTAAVPSLGLSETESASGATIIFGAGGAINISRNVSVRAEWTRYAIDETLRLANSDITTPDIDVFSATFIFRFR